MIRTVGPTVTIRGGSQNINSAGSFVQPGALGVKFACLASRCGS